MQKLIFLSSISGILTPIIAFTCISLAINYSPKFSWADNALSDLGVQEGITAPLFNYGLIISGILAFIFALGLFTLLKEKKLGGIGALLFIIDTLALIAIGVFPESAGVIHFYVSVLFFMLFPIANLIIFATFMLSGETKIGIFTILVAVAAAAPWIWQFTIKFGSNVAIPETISALSASTWIIVLGFKMLRKAYNSTKQKCS